MARQIGVRNTNQSRIGTGCDLSHRQELQTGRVRKSPLQTRNHRLPHMHCMTTGILQTNGPASATTTSSASRNTKLDLQCFTNIQPSPHSCNQRIMPYRILFFITCGRIHTITEQSINQNTTILTSQCGVLPWKQAPHVCRTQSKPRITNLGTAENRQPEKWPTRSNYITTGNQHSVLPRESMRSPGTLPLAGRRTP